RSATTALTSRPDRGSTCACASALLLAKLSFSNPQRPLGSAAVTAMPAIITLSRRSFHSSGVKFDLSVIGVNPPLARHVAEGRREATGGAVHASPVPITLDGHRRSRLYRGIDAKPKNHFGPNTPESERAGS